MCVFPLSTCQCPVDLPCGFGCTELLKLQHWCCYRNNFLVLYLVLLFFFFLYSSPLFNSQRDLIRTLHFYQSLEVLHSTLQRDSNIRNATDLLYANSHRPCFSGGVGVNSADACLISTHQHISVSISRDAYPSPLCHSRWEISTDKTSRGLLLPLDINGLNNQRKTTRGC